MNKLDIVFLSDVFPFWKNLKLTDKQQLIDNINVFKYKKGEQIQSGAENCTGVMAIKQGQLRAYMLSDEGKEITLYRLLDGDVCILSASCILKNISFEMHIDAESDAEIYVIIAAAYDDLSKRNIEIEAFISQTVAARFSDAMWVMEQIVFMKLDKRVALFLLEESALVGSDMLNITHSQIANHLGTAREVITRMFKYFQKEGIISVSRKGVEILDRKKLKSLTE